MNIEDRFEGVKVKIGQRVVRGKDWKYDDADGGEGNIGTVMFVNHEKEMVIVQWDSQEKRSNYRIGKDKKFDLRLFDNAQTGAKHRNYTCDECYTSPIYGMKWKCRQCENFDLCSDCYMSNEDDLSHVFERKLEEDSISVELGPRKYLQPVEARGILPCADVKLRDYTTKEETVVVKEEVLEYFFDKLNEKFR
ncbi:E3 ubiquitin-protein ligase MIB2-like [Saccostrea cucullata]|uniref:E3 ubiquitin-protein ligase MIB2-like n=1 Tax=Saccostrea cuccullata TaxID=36930 RepID=UPI002ED5C79B